MDPKSLPGNSDAMLNIDSRLDQRCANICVTCAISIVLRHVVKFWSSMYRVKRFNENCVNIVLLFRQIIASYGTNSNFLQIFSDKNCAINILY